MKVRVKYFGIIAEALKQETEYILLENGKHLNDFTELIETFHPQLQGFVFKLAINQVIAENNLELKQDDEIALLPPYAGG